MYELEKHVLLLKKIYDDVKIIDPLINKELTFKNGKITVVNGILEKYSYNSNENSEKQHINYNDYMEPSLSIGYKNGNPYTISKMPLRLEGKFLVLQVSKRVKDDINDLLINKNEKTSVMDNLDDEYYKNNKTGIFNDKYLYKRLPFDINKSISNNTNITMIMYKLWDKSNDVQTIENEVYSYIGKIIKKSIREDDWATTLNDDKFIIIIKNVDYNVSTSISKRISDDLNRMLSATSDNLFITTTFCIIDHIEKLSGVITVEKLINTALDNIKAATIDDQDVIGCRVGSE